MALLVTVTKSKLAVQGGLFWREGVPSAVRRRVKQGSLPDKLICSWGGKG